MTTLDPKSKLSLAELRALSDGDLIARLTSLSSLDQEITVELLRHLAEVEARGLHCSLGCSSLFSYCVERLGFSEDVAYKRVGASRLGRRFPLVLQLLAQGSVHLSGVMLLKSHLTEENHRDWLLAIRNKTKRQVLQFIASYCPSPEVPTSIRKLPQRP